MTDTYEYTIELTPEEEGEFSTKMYLAAQRDYEITAAERKLYKAMMEYADKEWEEYAKRLNERD